MDRTFEVKLGDKRKAENIIAAVCHFTGVSDKIIRGPKGNKNIFTARYYAFYLIRKHTQLTLVEIARMFNRKNHTVVMYGNHRIEEQRKIYPQIAHDLVQIESTIGIGLELSHNRERAFLQDEINKLQERLALLQEQLRQLEQN